MHAALARLVNNEMTRKQEKIDPIPKRSSREAELSPRGSAPRLVKRQRPPAIAAAVTRRLAAAGAGPREAPRLPAVSGGLAGGLAAALEPGQRHGHAVDELPPVLLDGGAQDP